MEELGFKGFEHMAFVGLSAPKGTPPAVIAKLNKALNDSLQAPAALNTTEAYGRYMADEAKHQAELAKLTGHE